METELKFLCSPATLKDLSGHPLLGQLALDPPKSTKLTSTYFDTPELLLRRQGLGLRVRKMGRAYVQTLKGGGGVRSGLHQRDEWETQVTSNVPELRRLISAAGSHSRMAKFLSDPEIETRLAPVFETVFKRRSWQLTLACGARIEVALDAGLVRKGELTEPISEMELELKSGHLESLFEVASRLLEGVSFRIGRSSKAARGYAMHGTVTAEICKAEPIVLPAECTVANAVSLILENCLNQVHGNEIGVVSGEDVESVHQMRVGLRRLRCALRLFKGVVTLPEPLLEELNWVCSELGGARDMEVLAGSTLEALDVANPTLEGTRDLRHVILERARAQRRLVVEALESERYARLALALGAWACHASKISAPEPLAPLASRLLARLHRKLVARGESLETATPEQRHALRIGAKRLRYATEFFGSLYPQKAIEKFTGKLRQLQDILGWFNDVASADRLLRGMSADHPRVAAPISFALGWLAGRLEGDAAVLRQQWKKLIKLETPWGH